MSEKIQGTIIIDGLVEGRSQELSEVTPRVRQWIEKARTKGLHLSLDIDGATFSVLADNRPLSSAGLGEDAAKAIADMLGELVAIFPLSVRTGLTSSIRSVEYGRNVEVQTVYAVNALGEIETRQRTVDTQTTAPAEPLTKRQIIKFAAIGLVMAAVVFGISAIFLDYGEIFDRLGGTTASLDTKALPIDKGSFADYFTIKAEEVKGRLELTLKRTKAFPKNDEELAALFKEAGDSPTKTLTAQALARGYVRCEMFTKKDKFIGHLESRIVDLRTKETVKISLPLTREYRLTRVAITY